MKCPVINFQKIRHRKHWPLISALCENVSCQPEDLQILRIVQDHEYPETAIIWYRHEDLVRWARFAYGSDIHEKLSSYENPSHYSQSWR